MRPRWGCAKSLENWYDWRTSQSKQKTTFGIAVDIIILDFLEGCVHFLQKKTIRNLYIRPSSALSTVATRSALQLPSAREYWFLLPPIQRDTYISAPNCLFLVSFCSKILQKKTIQSSNTHLATPGGHCRVRTRSAHLLATHSDSATTVGHQTVLIPAVLHNVISELFPSIILHKKNDPEPFWVV